MLGEDILQRINREIGSHRERGGGYIALKLNGLVDPGMIRALYEASMAGVKIDLNVRGMCCLRPGVKGISDNISELSIVGRFLEHARIYYFGNGGNDELLLGSADLMPRNIHNRIEVLFPVPDGRLKRAIVDCMLKVHLKDNVKGRVMLPNGEFVRRKDLKPRARGYGVRDHDQRSLSSQDWLLQNRGIWHDYKG